MQTGHHVLMQDAGDENAIGLLAVKDDVAALFNASKARSNLVAGATLLRNFGEAPTARLKFIEIAVCLRGSPGAERVFADAEEIEFSAL